MHLDPVNIARDDVFGVRGESPGYAVNLLKTAFQSFPMKAMPHARKRLRRGQAKFLGKRKAMQARTLVRITKTKAAPNALFPPGKWRDARLGDVLVLTSKPCGGLMAGVLPKSPPTPEVRDFAKAVLKASGVRLIRAATSARPDTGQDSNPPK